DAADPDLDPLAYSLLDAPAGMTIDSATGLVRWSPLAGDVGTYSLRPEVTDGRGGAAEQRFDLRVTTPPPNRPPVFATAPIVDAFVGRPYLYDADATD